MSLFFLALSACCVSCSPRPSGSLAAMTHSCPVHPFPWPLIFNGLTVLPAIHSVPSKPIAISSVSIIPAALPPPCCCSPVLLPIFTPSPHQPHARGSISFHPPLQITPRALVAVMVWRGTRWTKQQWDSTTRARQRSTTLRKVSWGSPVQQAVSGLAPRNMPAGAVGHCAWFLKPAV